MKRLILVVSFVLACCAAAAPAQSPATSADQSRQFDFLIGAWQIELLPKVSGLAALVHGQPKLQGTWKAWAAFDGSGIVDELRVIDSSGNPKAYTHTLRLYDADAQRWLISALDVYRARTSQAQAQLHGAQLQIDGKGLAHDGSEFLSRTRFGEVSTDAFRMQQDRSYDGGASWEEESLVIVAKRIAAQAAR